MVNFIFFSLLISAKKKKIHWNASLVRYPDRNILSFFSNGCIFVANKLNIGLSIVYYLLHRIRYCVLYIYSKMHIINVQVHLWLLCLVMDYYANIARGWEVGFELSIKTKNCVNCEHLFVCINYDFTTRYEWMRWYLQECLFVTWDVFVVDMRILFVVIIETSLTENQIEF